MAAIFSPARSGPGSVGAGVGRAVGSGVAVGVTGVAVGGSGGIGVGDGASVVVPVGVFAGIGVTAGADVLVDTEETAVTGVGEGADVGCGLPLQAIRIAAIRSALSAGSQRTLLDDTAISVILLPAINGGSRL